MIDLGTGNNNKINWAIDDKQEVRLPSLLVVAVVAAASLAGTHPKG